MSTVQLQDAQQPGLESTLILSMFYKPFLPLLLQIDRQLSEHCVVEGETRNGPHVSSSAVACSTPRGHQVSVE